MTADEGLTIFLYFLAVAWLFVIAFAFTDVLIPWVLDLIAERCRRRHPGSRA